MEFAVLKRWIHISDLDKYFSDDKTPFSCHYLNDVPLELSILPKYRRWWDSSGENKVSATVTRSKHQQNSYSIHSSLWISFDIAVLVQIGRDRIVSNQVPMEDLQWWISKWLIVTFCRIIFVSIYIFLIVVFGNDTGIHHRCSKRFIKLWYRLGIISFKCTFISKRYHNFAKRLMISIYMVNVTSMIRLTLITWINKVHAMKIRRNYIQFQISDDRWNEFLINGE